MPKRILILSGTSDGRAAAEALVAAGHVVISSLAGATAKPVLPSGQVRVGGFGGSAGLSSYLADEAIDAVVDATHPFAAQISHHAHAACEERGVPLIRLERSAWQSPADGTWTRVASFQAALEALPNGARVLVTTGRKQLELLAGRPDLSGVVRTIETPLEALPSGWVLLRERPPFTLEREKELMRSNGVSHLVTKNAGGGLTKHKIVAANALGVDVLMIERPAKPLCRTVETVEALVTAVGSLWDNG